MKHALGIPDFLTLLSYWEGLQKQKPKVSWGVDLNHQPLDYEGNNHLARLCLFNHSCW
jgi:hypothetical protein